jgi:hypothetical protein
VAVPAELLLSALTDCPCGCEDRGYDPGGGLDKPGRWVPWGGDDAPLTSEPPLAEDVPLTSEPPLAAEPPLTSEPTGFVGATSA